jgi:hypothetical protein
MQLKLNMPLFCSLRALRLNCFAQIVQPQLSLRFVKARKAFESHLLLSLRVKPSNFQVGNSQSPAQLRRFRTLEFSLAPEPASPRFPYLLPSDIRGKKNPAFLLCVLPFCGYSPQIQIQNDQNEFFEHWKPVIKSHQKSSEVMKSHPCHQTFQDHFSKIVKRPISFRLSAHQGVVKAGQASQKNAPLSLDVHPAYLPSRHSQMKFTLGIFDLRLCALASLRLKKPNSGRGSQTDAATKLELKRSAAVSVRVDAA